MCCTKSYNSSTSETCMEVVRRLYGGCTELVCLIISLHYYYFMSRSLRLVIFFWCAEKSKKYEIPATSFSCRDWCDNNFILSDRNIRNCDEFRSIT